MNIKQVAHEVLHNNTAIEYDNGNIEMLRKALKFIFRQHYHEAYGCSVYYLKDTKSKNWTSRDYFHKDTITTVKLSSITFDELTVESLIELRKQFPNNLMFGDAFDLAVKDCEFVKCGQGENVCKCKNKNQCGYL